MSEHRTVPAFTGIKDERLGNLRLSRPLAPVSGHCAEESKQERRTERNEAGCKDEIRIDTKSQVAT